MAIKKKYTDFESAMNRLQELTATLESGEAKLEDAIDLYTEGLEIVKFCNQKLAEAEKKIKLITEQNGQTVETDFEGASS
ncbi:MAG: exodeoxyribonuclease VII small subunit [candidate division Zixibacteria bacterium]|nr:exodeoxyribonuclease VII small subunit [candidate division Zixibacteria bacterium]